MINRKYQRSQSSGKKELETLAEEEEEGEEEGEGEESNSAKERNEQKDATAPMKKSQKKLTMLDRSKYGKYIVTYDAGKSFGEVALVKRESFRNASIIADEDVDLLVIGQDLFNRSLKADQEKEFEEISRFIDRHPFFHSMPNRLKKLLEMSLRRKTYIFESVIVRQGDPVTGLQFILNGQANVTIEPHKHPKQYKHLWPFEAGVDIYSIEFEHLREARRQAILRQYEDPSVWETYPEEVTIRIEEGYPAIEKRMKEKHVLLCSVQKHEVIGDIELLMNLDTHVQTITCTANTDVFILDTKNFDRVVGKKNAATLDIMKEHLKNKLNTRMNMKQGELIPFLKFLYQKLTAETLPQSKPLPPLRTSKELPDKETQIQQLITLV
ncbi:hypothetical protein FSP39_015348 [Pinctada imbricata]|uniref:Cyclic nucleotide-binding domain-containing protein n=1 Tax=Pinctada imbricata TaxID=66713 RepID=A0AA89C6V4_PINIB|nr:hypothetical protein FSP39_015348 [Pinctada imbricata]